MKLHTAVGWVLPLATLNYALAIPKQHGTTAVATSNTTTSAGELEFIPERMFGSTMLLAKRSINEAETIAKTQDVGDAVGDFLKGLLGFKDVPNGASRWVAESGEIMVGSQPSGWYIKRVSDDLMTKSSVLFNLGYSSGMHYAEDPNGYKYPIEKCRCWLFDSRRHLSLELETKVVDSPCSMECYLF